MNKISVYLSDKSQFDKLNNKKTTRQFALSG